MNKKDNKSIDLNNIEDIKKMLYKIIDTINYAELIQAQHDCNDCGRNPNCELAPRVGESVRINCYAWREK